MMEHYVKIKCDICGKEDLMPYRKELGLYKDQWKEFVLGDLYKIPTETRDPSTVCPQCAERIGKFIYAMQNEYKKGCPT